MEKINNKASCKGSEASQKKRISKQLLSNKFILRRMEW